MFYKILKLHFLTGIHIGNGMLTDGEFVIHADTIFSVSGGNAFTRWHQKVS